MAVKIRLRRMGRKKQPHYRIVVADSDSPRDGRFVESLGYYKPLSHPARLVVDLERVEYWEGQGARPSNTVANLLKKARRGGDASVALGEVDKEAEKKAQQEELATRRRAEADAKAKEEAEAKAKAKAEADAKAKAKAEEEAKAQAGEEAEKAEAKGESASAADEKAPTEEPSPDTSAKAEGEEKGA